MKNAKLFVLAILITAWLMPQRSIAQQGPPDPKRMATRQNEWMKTTLSLDSTQTKAVEKLNQKYAEKSADLFAGGFSPEVREQMQALNTDKEVELKKLLTPEQWKTYEAKKGEMRGGGRRREK